MGSVREGHRGRDWLEGGVLDRRAKVTHSVYIYLEWSRDRGLESVR